MLKFFVIGDKLKVIVLDANNEQKNISSAEDLGSVASTLNDMRLNYPPFDDSVEKAAQRGFDGLHGK